MRKSPKNLVFLLAVLFGSAVFSLQASAQEQADYSNDISLTGSFLASQFARSSGDIDGAIHYLKRVHKKQPDDIEIAGQLISLMLLDGQVKEASQIVSKLKNGFEKDPLILLVRILHEIKDNNINQAAAYVDDAFESGVGQLWLPLISSWIDVVQYPPTEPVTIQQFSGNLSRSVPILHYQLALINEHAGFYEAAAGNFKDAIENPKNPPTRVMEQLLRFYSQHESPALLKPIVVDYLAIHPEMAVGGKLPKFSIQDGVAEVLYSMGSVMRAAGIAHDALAYLQLALFVKPDLQVAHMALGDAYGDAMMYERANTKAYSKIKAGDRNYANAQIRYAVNLERLGDLPAALRSLDKLSKDKNTVNLALTTKGDLLRSNHRYDEAIHAYSSVLNSFDQLGKDDWALLFARAVCFERTGKWEDAENDLLKALVVSPDQPDVLNYLGFSWLVRGYKVEEASGMIEKALAARPNDPHIIDSMGWALYIRGQYNDAAKYMERAVSLIPSDPTVNDHLGDIYWKLGRKTEARYQWERSLSYKPDEKLAQLIAKKLENGLDANAAKKTLTPVIVSDQGSKTLVP
ncbi:MAG: tetratricopeptide repeat protein [Rickettsiales bacterium]|jgi:tetratricopeptide (TPR) repeat protein|nr:tetratricopeptide repeat protein [Rickettsiales bacterium]